jgi:hypothetical protein
VDDEGVGACVEVDPASAVGYLQAYVFYDAGEFVGSDVGVCVVQD